MSVLPLDVDYITWYACMLGAGVVCLYGMEPPGFLQNLEYLIKKRVSSPHGGRVKSENPVAWLKAPRKAPLHSGSLLGPRISPEFCTRSLESTPSRGRRFILWFFPTINYFKASKQLWRSRQAAQNILVFPAWPRRWYEFSARKGQSLGAGG